MIRLRLPRAIRRLELHVGSDSRVVARLREQIRGVFPSRSFGCTGFSFGLEAVASDSPAAAASNSAPGTTVLLQYVRRHTAMARVSMTTGP